MMNINIDLSRIPIQSLAGLTTLTDILPELPLPTPTQASLSSQSFLFDPRLYEESCRWLQSQDADLVSSLTIALASTHTDDIDLKDGSSSDQVDHAGIPLLLQAIVGQNQGIFQHKREFAGMFRPVINMLSNPNIALDDSHNSSPLTLRASLEGSAHSNRSNSSSKHRSDRDKHSEGASPNKKHKKKKKKKHREKDKERKFIDKVTDNEEYSVVRAEGCGVKLKLKLLKPIELSPPRKKHDRLKRKLLLNSGTHPQLVCRVGDRVPTPPLGVGGVGFQLPAQPPALPDTPMFRSNILGAVLAQPFAQQSSTTNTNVYGNGVGNAAAASVVPADSLQGAAMNPTTNLDYNDMGHYNLNSFGNNCLVPALGRSFSFGSLPIVTNGNGNGGGGLFDLESVTSSATHIHQRMFGEHWPDLSAQLPANASNTTRKNSPAPSFSNPATPASFVAPSPALSKPAPSPAASSASHKGVCGMDKPSPSRLGSSVSVTSPQQNNYFQHQPSPGRGKPSPHHSQQRKSFYSHRPSPGRGKPSPQPHNNNVPAEAVAGHPFIASLLGHSPAPSMSYAPSLDASAVYLDIPFVMGHEYHDSLQQESSTINSSSVSRSADVDNRNDSASRQRKRGKRKNTEVDGLRVWHIKDKRATGRGRGSATASAAVASAAQQPENDVWEDVLGSYSSVLGERVKQRRRKAREGIARQKSSSCDQFDDGDEANPQLKGGSDSDENPDDDDDADGDYENERSGRRKKDDDKPFEIRLKNEFAPLKQARSRECRRERVSCGLSVNISLLPMEDLLETGTFKRFRQAIDGLLDQVEDVDMRQIQLDGSDLQLPEEAMISRGELTELANESSKLKSVNVINQVPTERLVRLLSVLLLNIVDGARVVPNAAPGHDDHGDESRLWREVALERVMRSIEAALVALNIMTSGNMPKEVFVEEVIERVVQVVKFQLTNTVFPEFDPAYRVVNKAKDNQGSIKSRRAKERTAIKPRWVMTLYNRLVDLLGGLAQLVSLQRLTDNIILSLSTLGISPFFVENIAELQLNALKLTTALFSIYPKHRQLIMEDIFASLARLPSSKRNLRSYRLNSEDNIQMLTALALLLIQSVVRLSSGPDEAGAGSTGATHDQELSILSSYDDALHTSIRFLSVFLKKCTTKGEDDFRPVFENFVMDLLLAVNKPEWPAAETLLSLLGSLLVKRFSDKQVEQSMRVTSLDYLGTVASRLRRDAVSSQLNERDIDQIICDINRGRGGGEDEEDAASPRTTVVLSREERVSALQQAILDFLSSEEVEASENASSASVNYAGRFYLVQWLKDCSAEAQRFGAGVGATGQDDSDLAASHDLVRRCEVRKLELMKKMRNYALITGGIAGASDTELSAVRPKSSDSVLDYEEACLVCRYLASLRPFSQSFDVYLAQILKVLNEQSVAVRTKAMKCLTAVVEADPGVLERKDIERSVHARFLDTSTSVREAAIELIGKFVLLRHQLTEQYYPMLAERILDTGISVRKRVIKIFRDICLEQPDFTKIPEICVKMIRRVNDEEGIKKLVNEVFQSMWFSPVKDRNTVKLLQKVMNITDVVASCQDTGYEWFEHLLSNLLKKEEAEKLKPVERACRQIVDTLVQNIMRLEEVSSNNNQRLVACLATLHLFTKIRPHFMIQNASTLQPYLSIKCATQADAKVLHYVARILEVTVPLMEHPSEVFLCQLEEDMVRLIVKQGMLVLESCVRCLGAVVNRVSKNYALVRTCFSGFFRGLVSTQNELEESEQLLLSKQRKPAVLRALFTCGLLCQYFDFDSHAYSDDAASSSADQFDVDQFTVRDHVFNTLMFYTKLHDVDVVRKALTGLGFVCVRHPSLLMNGPLKELYLFLLCSRDPQHVEHQNVLLNNLICYLQAEEQRMVDADAHWNQNTGAGSQAATGGGSGSAAAAADSLKDMCDVQSGMASTIAQMYLEEVLDCFYSTAMSVRQNALTVICTILRQGLIHPIKTVPFLVCAQTDIEAQVRSKADSQLQEIEKKYPGFIHMRALAGVRQSYMLQKVIQKVHLIRGLRDEEAEISTAANHTLYGMVRVKREQRRAFLYSLVNLFDDAQRSALGELLFIADNLATFNYQSWEEPLYVIHQADLLVSVTGNNLLQSALQLLGIRDLQDDVTAERLAELCVSRPVMVPQQAPTAPPSTQYSLPMEQQHHPHNLQHHQMYPPYYYHQQHQQQQMFNMYSNDSSWNIAMNAISVEQNHSSYMYEGSSQHHPHQHQMLVKKPATPPPPSHIVEYFDPTAKLQEIVKLSKACVLLLTLKQYLKDTYNITEAKIQKYSPNDNAKLWEKPIQRRNTSHFEPVLCLTWLKRERASDVDVKQSGAVDEDKMVDKVLLCQDLLDFQHLMLSVDPVDGSDDEPIGGASAPGHLQQALATVVNKSVIEQGLRLRVNLGPVDDNVNAQMAAALSAYQATLSTDDVMINNSDADSDESTGPRIKMPIKKSPRRGGRALKLLAGSKNARGARSAKKNRRSGNSGGATSRRKHVRRHSSNSETSISSPSSDNDSDQSESD